MNHIENPNNINALKCHICGTQFKTQQILDRHKNRKTPCLIPEIVNKPNRCQYCNKIFSKKGNLSAHDKICKIKKNEANIPIEVKQEQKIKILEDRVANLLDVITDTNNKWQERFEKLESQITQPVIINTTINNPVIIINNYQTPNIDYLTNGGFLNSEFMRIYNEYRVQTPMQLASKIWFDLDHPENRSINFINGKSIEIHDGTQWIKDTPVNVIPKLRNAAYDLTERMCEKGEEFLSDNHKVIRDQLKTNKIDTDVIKHDNGVVAKILVANKAH